MADEKTLPRRAAARPAADPPADGPPLPRIRAFQLVRCVGEGGMGVVYLAEQSEPVRRRVALKVMRTALASEADRLRFRTEQQALATLEHPNVTRLFEVGTTPEGMPFIAMEWVPGDTVCDYCDSHRLGIRARIELFLTVCDGVHHAHQKGVIHRDIKPSNVLVTEVDGRPVAKVIDFGIAKALSEEAPSATLLGEHLLGTPSYISPEAVRSGRASQVDTRADVYALGLILYRLLAGSQPFEEEDRPLLDRLRDVAETGAPEPTRWLARRAPAEVAEAARLRGTTPRGLLRALRGDLDWIVMRAVAREPGERYGSVSDFRADLQRYLRHEPLEARAPGTLYRLRRLARRHRGAVAGGAAVLAVLLAGIATTTLEARRAREAQEQSDRVATFLADLFSEANPWNANRPDMTAHDLLLLGARRLQTDLSEDPVVRARLMQEIGVSLMHQGDGAAAGPLLEEALRLRRAHLGPRDYRVGNTLLELGVLRKGEGRLEEAERLLRGAAEVQRAAGRPVPHAQALADLGTLLELRGRLPEARVALEESLRIREREMDPGDPWIANSLTGLGRVYALQGEFARADSALQRAQAIRLARNGPEHYSVSRTLKDIGFLRIREGRWAEADSVLRRSLAIAAAVRGPDHPFLAPLLRDLAQTADHLDRAGEAGELRRRAAAIERTAPAP